MESQQRSDEPAVSAPAVRREGDANRLSFWRRIGLARSRDDEDVDAPSRVVKTESAPGESASDQASELEKAASRAATQAAARVEARAERSLDEHLGAVAAQLERVESSLESRGENFDRSVGRLAALEDHFSQLADLRDWMGEAREGEREIKRRLQSLERSLRLAIAAGVLLAATAIVIAGRAWLGF